MKKQHCMAGLGVLLVFIVGGIMAYREGYLWKTTIGLSPAMKRLKECPIHKAPLEIEKVKVHTGRSHACFPKASVEEYAKLFPYYNNGTISSMDPKVGWAKVKYCPECRLALKTWLENRLREVEQAAPSNGNKPSN